MVSRLFVLFLMVALLGCGTQAPPESSPPAHNPDDIPITEADVNMPASYAEALPQIKGYRDTIRTAIEAGPPSKAHRALDELDIVLGKLPAIAKHSGVPQEQWESINASARELRNLFNQLHSAIDENRQPDYPAVAEPIDQAIAKLDQVTQ